MYLAKSGCTPRIYKIGMPPLDEWLNLPHSPKNIFLPLTISEWSLTTVTSFLHFVLQWLLDNLRDIIERHYNLEGVCRYAYLTHTTVIVTNELCIPFLQTLSNLL